MTLPGVDYTIAHALKATLADVSRFPDPTRPRATWDCTQRKQSAGKCYNGPITKAGASQVRWLLVQAAQCVGSTRDRWGPSFASSRTEEPQRGGHGNRPKNGDDRLAHAQE